MSRDKNENKESERDKKGREESRVRFTRYAMYKDIRSTISHLNVALEGEVLTISGTPKEIMRVFNKNKTHLTEASYPEVDLHKLPYKGNYFDWAISDQVLEHVKYPWLAVEETRRVLKPGGLAIHTSCSFNPVHLHPRDYWRFLPDGMKVLCERFSKVIRCASWGNRKAMELVIKGERPHLTEKNRKIAACNEQDWPFVVWIIAKK